MAKRTPTITDKFMNEVILYGGLPLRRHDVHTLALEDTESMWAADLFAFDWKKQPVDCEPFTIEMFRQLTERQ